MLLFVRSKLAFHLHQNGQNGQGWEQKRHQLLLIFGKNVSGESFTKHLFAGEKI